MRYALIDESGRLYDPKDRTLVLAVLATKTLLGVDRIIPKIRNKIPYKGKRRKERLAEIKFSLAGDRTRQIVLEAIAKQKVKIYLLVVDKRGRKIKDNPENYALLLAEALRRPLNEDPQLEHILIDRHFTYVTQREKFNSLLQKRLDRTIFIEHLDSQQNSVISLADFIAGAVRHACMRGDGRFKKIIDNLIVDEKLITWQQLKQKSGKP